MANALNEKLIANDKPLPASEAKKSQNVVDVGLIKAPALVPMRDTSDECSKAMRCTSAA